jgi:hypothetical protein
MSTAIFASAPDWNNRSQKWTVLALLTLVFAAPAIAADWKKSLEESIKAEYRPIGRIEKRVAIHSHVEAISDGNLDDWLHIEVPPGDLDPKLSDLLSRRRRCSLTNGRGGKS